MILYHTSYLEIKNPDLSHVRNYLDFGLGFYLTPSYNQAVNYSNKFKIQNKDSFINEYSFDDKAYQTLSILKFDSYSEEWLDFIINCRHGNDKTHQDIVIGGVVNDKVFNTVELFFDNLIDKKEAIKRLKNEKRALQYCFRTEQALSYLQFERSIKL